MRRSQFLRGTAACLLAAAFRPAFAAGPARLPMIASKALDGRAVSLPDGLPGERSMVIVTTKREHTEGRVAWADRMGGHAAVPLVDLAIFDDYGAMFRGLVESEMKKGSPDAVSRARLVLVSGGKAALLASLGIRSEDRAVALVVERATGLVLASEAGAPGEASAARLSAALRGRA